MNVAGRRLIIAVVGVLGFAIAFVLTFAVGVESTSRWQCDGVCFGSLDEVLLVALVVGGAAGALVAAIADFVIKPV
jgi:hypothetical protein